MRLAPATAAARLLSLLAGIAFAEEVRAWRMKSTLDLVDAVSLASAGEFAVEGQPYNIVSVGGAGQTHETE